MFCRLITFKIDHLPRSHDDVYKKGHRALKRICTQLKEIMKLFIIFRCLLHALYDLYQLLIRRKGAGTSKNLFGWFFFLNSLFICLLWQKKEIFSILLPARTIPNFVDLLFKAGNFAEILSTKLKWVGEQS